MPTLKCYGTGVRFPAPPLQTPLAIRRKWGFLLNLRSPARQCQALGGLEPESSSIDSGEMWHIAGDQRSKNDNPTLVGDFGKNRSHPILGTSGASDVVYWKLHNAIARDRRRDD